AHGEAIRSSLTIWSGVFIRSSGRNSHSIDFRIVATNCRLPHYPFDVASTRFVLNSLNDLRENRKSKALAVARMRLDGSNVIVRTALEISRRLLVAWLVRSDKGGNAHLVFTSATLGACRRVCRKLPLRT